MYLADEDSGDCTAANLGEKPASLAIPKMKYIRHRKLGFILFEGGVAHDEVARGFGEPDDIVSAGFVFTPGIELKCLGYSGTLNLSAGPADAADLKRRMTTP